jgi:hypothetical protein
MTETELIDAVIKQALELERLAAGDQAQAAAALQVLENELKALVATRYAAGMATAELNALIVATDKAIAAAYGGISGIVDISGIMAHVAQGIQAVIAPGAAITKALSGVEVLFGGAPLAAWWGKQADDTAFQFAAVVRQGLANNETVDQITARVVGKAGEAGVMDISRRNARTLVHSAVMSAANTARLAVYRDNGDAILGVKWQATLDGHTCKRCAALDGQSWDLEGKRLKGTHVNFIAPPIHGNDRCVLSPIPRTTALDEAFPGISAAFGQIGDRVSSKGLQPKGTTFAQFFDRLTPAEQDAQFGPVRARMMREGKITVRDLISGAGRELKLSEIRRKGT